MIIYILLIWYDKIIAFFIKNKTFLTENYIRKLTKNAKQI